MHLLACGYTPMGQGDYCCLEMVAKLLLHGPDRMRLTENLFLDGGAERLKALARETHAKGKTAGVLHPLLPARRAPPPVIGDWRLVSPQPPQPQAPHTAATGPAPDNVLPCLPQLPPAEAEAVGQPSTWGGGDGQESTPPADLRGQGQGACMSQPDILALITPATEELEGAAAEKPQAAHRPDGHLTSSQSGRGGAGPVAAPPGQLQQGVPSPPEQPKLCLGAVPTTSGEGGAPGAVPGRARWSRRNAARQHEQRASTRKPLPRWG